MKIKTWKFLISGLLVMLLSIGVESWVLNQLNCCNGAYGLHKTVFVARNQTNGYKSTTLSLDDISYLQANLPTSSLSFLARQDGTVKGNGHTAQVKILGTNAQWPSFHEVRIESGAMWTREADWESQRVALISSDLAVLLFGSANIIGMDINILEAQFLVIGVFTPNPTILEHLSTDNLPEVYIPGEAFFETVKNPMIRELQIASPGTSGENNATLPNLLLEVGKDPAAFTSIDYSPGQILMEQAPRLQIFIMGLLFILLLLYIWQNFIKCMIKSLRSDIQEQSIRTVFKKHRWEIGMFLIQTAALWLIILWIWSRIHFSFYIPPRYIPEDLIDISFFTELIKQAINNQQGLTEFYRAGPEAQLEIGGIINRCCYYLIWPLGLGLFLCSWLELKKKVGGCYE